MTMIGFGVSGEPECLFDSLIAGIYKFDIEGYKLSNLTKVNATKIKYYLMK
mgnify:FL=1